MTKILFSGDISLFKTLPDNFIDPELLNLFKKYNQVIGNFEFPFSKEKNPKFNFSYENYIASEKFIPVLRDLNLKGCNIANNHIYDWGIEGIETTKKILEKNNIEVFGAGKILTEARKPLIIEENEIRFGLLGYCKKGLYSATINTPGASVIDLALILEDVNKLKKEVDHVILNLHWGVELSDYPTSSDIELAHVFIDSGVSVIIGHHPHVIQGFEKYNNGLIFYSLGSFIYDPWGERVFVKKKLKERTESILVEITFSKGKIEGFDVIPVKVTPEKTIRLMNDREKEKCFSRLSELNSNLYDKQIFYSEAANNLIVRETKTYLNYFKSNPFGAIKLFIKNFKFRYIVMMFYLILSKIGLIKSNN